MCKFKENVLFCALIFANILCVLSGTDFVMPEAKFDEFRGVMMYFNELWIADSALQEIKVDGTKSARMEGAFGEVVAAKLVDTIKSLNGAVSDVLRLLD